MLPSYGVRPPWAERPIAAAGADRERGRRTVLVGSTRHHAIGGSPSTSLRQEEQSVTLMRFDPFRELDRLAERTLPVGARGLRSTRLNGE